MRHLVSTRFAREVIGRWRRQYAANQLVERSSVRERELEKENQRLKVKVGELVLEMDHLKKLGLRGNVWVDIGISW